MSDTIDQMLGAIEGAEWRGRERESHWRRTLEAPKAGSSAFGPYQITRGLLQSALKNKVLSEASSQFAQQVMIPMQSLMLEFGREPKKPGYDPIYEYGGTGGFDTALHAQSYQQLARELLTHEWERNNRDQTATLEAWRGAKASENPSYFKAARKKLK